MESIEEQRKKRFQFMKKLFEKTDGSELNWVSMFDIGQELGFDRPTTEKITEYLKGEYLLEYKSLGGGIGITHLGIVEMESSLSNPQEPTQHFPPAINIINIGSMTNSQIQQGGIGNNQSYVNNAQIGELKDLVSTIKNSIDEIELNVTDKGDLNSELNTIGAQLSSSKPKKNVIVECLRSIKNIFEGVSGNVIAQTLLSQLGSILSNLTMS